MKQFTSWMFVLLGVSVILTMLNVDVSEATPRGRLAMSNKIMGAPRYTASVNQLGGNKVVSTSVAETEVDTREAERNACINNNVGMNNTFVWASKYSNTSNYTNMVEDVNNPSNNVCFVKVELKSDDDSRISVSDIPSKYFTWGENITCGSWVDEKTMEDRILKAGVGKRVGIAIATAVGSAGLGVGIMEGFGNKLIGGKLEGQKALSSDQLYRSQLLALQKDNPTQYSTYIENLITLKKSCDGKDLCREYQSLIDEFVK